ncbi:hypothetical protein EAF04_002397 [Stromatinia cepivora]|nr:hypothetical protein EAF04_002397 [Stromatinia cepivora]
MDNATRSTRKNVYIHHALKSYVKVYQQEPPHCGHVLPGINSLPEHYTLNTSRGLDIKTLLETIFQELQAIIAVKMSDKNVPNPGSSEVKENLNVSSRRMMAPSLKSTLSPSTWLPLPTTTIASQKAILLLSPNLSNYLHQLHLASLHLLFTLSKIEVKWYIQLFET